ncbi:MAG: rhodanese-like domain-containing protein, partial [Alphaproteobacteria bacterium]|nr:rhodanese-like domain-containing protein [Alphaproteobacteria bacterium]
KDLGYDKVFNLGAFKDWVDAGGEVVLPIEPGM